VGIGVGVGVGIGVGISLGIGVGVGLGIGVGISLGIGVRRRRSAFGARRSALGARRSASAASFTARIQVASLPTTNAEENAHASGRLGGGAALRPDAHRRRAERKGDGARARIRRGAVPRLD
jgi:hypothetical protein